MTPLNGNLGLRLNHFPLLAFHSYLANDMEEDRQGPKHGIFTFLFGQDRTQRVKFQWLRAQLFRAIGWKAWVTREECEEVGYIGEER